MVIKPVSSYSVTEGATSALLHLIRRLRGHIPKPFEDYAPNVRFITKAIPGDDVYFPCPIKEQEATAAIKALEGCAAAAIADLRSGTAGKSRSITVDVDKTACFLMSAYISTIDGMDKQTPGVKSKLQGEKLRILGCINVVLPST